MSALFGGELVRVAQGGNLVEDDPQRVHVDLDLVLVELPTLGAM